jgi:hypothetical protein
MATATRPAIPTLYAILRSVALGQLPSAALGKGLIAYSELSQRYQDVTDHWFEPHGSWDDPLGELNAVLEDHGYPALSAVVVLKDRDRLGPGEGFWKCPGVGPRPSNPEARFLRWNEILKNVYATAWPEGLPGSAPHGGAMSLAEIREAYPSEWVLLGDPRTDDDLNVLGGRVLWHSRDREDVHRKAIEIRPGHAAILFMGLVSGEFAVNL